MTISVGELPVAARQVTSATLKGVSPVGPASKPYLPDKFVGGRYDYVDPDDHTLNDLSDGGKFDFGMDDPIRIKEIRCIGAAATVTIEDKVGTYSSAVAVVTAGTIYSAPEDGLIVLPSQYIKVTMGAGSVDIYVVKADARH